MNGDVYGEVFHENHNLSDYPSSKQKKKKKKRKSTGPDDEELNATIKESVINSLSHIDYVLVHNDKTQDQEPKSFENRRKFETLIQNEGIHIDKENINDLVFVKLKTPFMRLCKEAERVKLKLPLKGCEIFEEDKLKTCCGRCEDWLFKTDDTVDFISAPFTRDKMHLFDNSDKPDLLFNPSLRGLLTHHILINLDIRTKTERFIDTDGDGDKEEDLLAKRGLPYLLHKNSYSDAFTLHDESVEDPVDKEAVERIKKAGGDIEMFQKELKTKDTRKELNDAWPKVYKYQPMWKVRNYFGEKIAFYFAWSGLLVSSLWIPMFMGLGVFVYGLYKSITETNEIDAALLTNLTNSSDTIDDEDFMSIALGIKDTVFEILAIIQRACDNEATPFFSLAMCIWGTIFLELWKRKSARLAYEWDVNDFEDAEPDRPQYFGTVVKRDPVSGEFAAYYPIIRRIFKFCFSCVCILVMILVVFISVGGVIIYRVIMRIDFCPKMSSVECLLVTTVASSLLNAVSIFILGKIYEKLAYLLTDWENHRTQTDYDDALIVKLFAFQFANNYSSLFYIAFVRGNLGESGVLGFGAEYGDSCSEPDNNCMPVLSFQVLILMIVKPFPKLLKDLLVPFLKKCLRKCCKKDNKVEDSNEKPCTVTINDYLDRERLKPVLGDFTLWEYTEKVIQYGYLMLFAVALPIAPLIALLTNLFDRGTDAKRLLWIYRRPLSNIAEDIGMWFPILEFINIVGVISNSFIIAFTTTFGREMFVDNWERLIAAILFEHIIFGIKYLIEVVIPDVPSNVRLAIRREKYQVSKLLETGMFLSDDNNGSGPGDGGGNPAGGDNDDDQMGNGLRRRKSVPSQSNEDVKSPRRAKSPLYPRLDEEMNDEEELIKPKKRKKKKKNKHHHDDPEDPETPRRPHHLEPLETTSSEKELPDFDYSKLPTLVRDKSKLRSSPTWEPPPMVAMPAPVYMGDTSFDMTINSSYA